MFNTCSKVTDINFSIGEYTGENIHIAGLFYNCRNLKNVSNFFFPSASQVGSVEYLFSSCGNLKNINLGSLKIGNKVSSLAGLFYDSNFSNFYNIPFEEWDVGNVANFSSMFDGIGVDLNNYFFERKINSWHSNATRIGCFRYVQRRFNKL